MPEVFSSLEMLIMAVVIVFPLSITGIFHLVGCRLGAWFFGGVTTVLFVMTFGYTINAIWYSSTARSGSLFVGSPLIIGKTAYLLGLAVEAIIILIAGLTSDWESHINSGRLREFVLRILFLLATGGILHYHPDILISLFGLVGWILTTSDIRSLLIPVLTALLAANLVEISYNLYCQYSQTYLTNNSE
ncbi:hypothetical protein [Halorubrum ruber]|uniref:Uncharacterized protein n=1 Tax=Halorubrum ruber TaxID=2982524 RepID=A0A8T8LJZ3_9EURY|nr:hypothetical protein [Halorubrum ruber]QUO47208.1 hypothetical protein J7656_11545 [Halorubrum ruber]